VVEAESVCLKGPQGLWKCLHCKLNNKHVAVFLVRSKRERRKKTPQTSGRHLREGEEDTLDHPWLTEMTPLLSDMIEMLTSAQLASCRHFWQCDNCSVVDLGYGRCLISETVHSAGADAKALRWQLDSRSQGPPNCHECIQFIWFTCNGLTTSDLHHFTHGFWRLPSSFVSSLDSSTFLFCLPQRAPQSVLDLFWYIFCISTCIHTTAPAPLTKSVTTGIIRNNGVRR